MSPELIGLIGIIVLLALLAARMWIALATGVVGFVGLLLLKSMSSAFLAAGQAPYQFITKYDLTVMPMFVLMGMIVGETGIGADLYEAAHRWLGAMRGGLSSATVAACALLAAITGSSMTGVLVMSKVALPEMQKYGYDDRLSTGVIAASATMGVLIPPSMGFIIYAMLTELSVGKLFMAGIIPGALEAVFYMATIFILCRINPKMGPRGPKYSFRDKIVVTRKIAAMLILFVLIMGGIYTGVFTPTEAGAVGALGAILITIFMRRFTVKGFFSYVMETGLMTGMILLMLMGVIIFQKFMAASRLPFFLGEIITSLDVPPILVMVGIIIMYIIAGCFLPAIMAIILTIPIIYPMVLAMGFDPIWFGVLLVRMTEIGDITPPMGMQCFVMSGVSGVPLGTVFRGVIPFVIADFCHVALLIAVPALSLYLPNHM